MIDDTPAMRIDLSVVTVTYRSRDQVEAAVLSATGSAEAAGVTSELIVVDNASDDGTADVVAEAFPLATLIRNPTNRGFGSANNQAFAIARGSVWLLLNPDARVDPGAIGTLLQAMHEAPRLGAVGPSISGAGVGGAESAGMLPGLRSLVGHFLFVNRLLPRGRGGPWRGFQIASGMGTQPLPVEWLSGAVLMLRPEAVQQVGGFDESIFMYGEDTDFCARLGDAGWRLAVLPGARAWHAIGGSQPHGSTGWIDGLDRYLASRGASTIRRRLAMLVVGCGLAIRATRARASLDAAARRHGMRMRSGAARAMRIATGDLRVSAHKS